jgi:uncharacterized protein (DUF885 family)
MQRWTLLCLVLAFSGACARKPPRFSTIAEEFVLNTLTFAPASATAAGYHRHNGVPQDELLDDFSQPSLNRQRAYYARFLQGLARDVTRSKLTPEDQVDFDIVQQQIAAAKFDLDEIRSWEKNPATYTNALGNSLFVPFVQEYAPENARFYHILKRLERFRSRVEQAKANLKNIPPFWAEMGVAANRANIELIREVRQRRPAEMSKKFDAAADEAERALADLGEHFQKAATGAPDSWRLGPEIYRKKLQLAHGAGQEPAALLAAAEAELVQLKAEMAKLAGPRGVKAKLEEIAKDHARREDFFAAAERDLAEAIAFVRAKDLMALPDTRNLKVIPTPAFMRGSYPVGGFNPAPTFQPTLGAQYWLTPIPSEWPQERAESKLREYNRYGLKLLTIHEAMPGHYVQFEFSNRIEPRGRRWLRSVYASGAFAEGWAIYSTELLLEAGYLNNDPNLRLTFLKQQLRAVSNTILDIKLHTQNWSEADAVKYLIEETFQEKEEAEAKLQRAKLSSVQLTEYFAGYRDFKRLRAAVEKREGARFNLKEFHRKVLDLGAIPISAAALQLTGQALP